MPALHWKYVVSCRRAQPAGGGAGPSDAQQGDDDRSVPTAQTKTLRHGSLRGAALTAGRGAAGAGAGAAKLAYDAASLVSYWFFA